MAAGDQVDEAIAVHVGQSAATWFSHSDSLDRIHCFEAKSPPVQIHSVALRRLCNQVGKAISVEICCKQVANSLGLSKSLSQKDKENHEFHILEKTRSPAELLTIFSTKAAIRANNSGVEKPPKSGQGSHGLHHIATAHTRQYR